MIEISVKKPLSTGERRQELSVDLHLERGSFTAIQGPSGSGKTTLLRILAGLEEAQGSIVVDSQVWLGEGRMLPPQRRSVGFVFQEYALFDNLSVRENLLYAAKDPDLADRLLAMTELEALKDRYPATLSGGQKQRVALCRALMRRPKILLLDEPLSALDPAMRRRLQEEILRLHREFGTTTLMVSHDPAEIYRLAERVLHLEAGRVTESGRPADLLLETAGSQKFSFRGEVLEIHRRDAIHVAVVAIGQQIVEIIIDASEARTLEAGQEVIVAAKAFAPSIGGVESPKDGER
ncbi:ABC transporter ATP-binding protein [Nitratifractor sp.]